MPFTLEQLSDRAEIQDLLVREAHALDKGHWDAWEQTFTPDADIDYSENDGARGRPAEIRVWLAETFATFPAAQHLTSNTEIELHGDHATARSMQYIGVDMVKSFCTAGSSNDRPPPVAHATNVKAAPNIIPSFFILLPSLPCVCL